VREGEELHGNNRRDQDTGMNKQTGLKATPALTCRIVTAGKKKADTAGAALTPWDLFEL
jgi:hypothetical protein